MRGFGNSYRCNVCSWVYDPAQGDPDGGIAPGTPWDEVPEDWVCPVCGASKADFDPIEAAGLGSVPARARSPLVILGSGLAGYGLAREFRKRDTGTPVLILTADGGEVYSKPMLSNAFARHLEPDGLVQKGAAALARELNVEIRTRTRVTGIDRHARTLRAGSVDIVYDRLVLALGADPRVFPVPGSESVAVATVNDLDDYRAWRQRIGRGGRILLIGAGLIGCEFANDLATAGFQVTLVDPAPWPLARLLPREIGEMLATALRELGCEPRMGRSVARYLNAGPEGFQAELDNGDRVGFDQVLSAVGLAPRVQLAKAAGIGAGTGILVDRLLRTDDPFIYAIGDCAQTEAGLLPFVSPLLAQARALAATLAGEETPLRLPAMPVVVKTPALPLVVCPPRPGIEGAWELELGEREASAIFRATDGAEVGFVLAGVRTNRHQALARRMPDLLPEVR